MTTTKHTTDCGTRQTEFRHERDGFIVELATRNDAGAIAEFNVAMALETESLALDSATVNTGVLAVFEEPARGLYLVVRREGVTCACLLVTREWSDWRNAEFWWIQSVYVVPEQRRKGVYGLLYDAVRQLGVQHGGICGFRLYVEKENARAQQTYRRVGMHETRYLMYEQLI